MNHEVLLPLTSLSNWKFSTSRATLLPPSLSYSLSPSLFMSPFPLSLTPEIVFHLFFQLRLQLKVSSNSKCTFLKAKRKEKRSVEKKFASFLFFSFQTIFFKGSLLRVLLCHVVFTAKCWQRCFEEWAIFDCCVIACRFRSRCAAA